MDLITKSNGLHHIAEMIFLNLDQEQLTKSIEVNAHWKIILENPWFWFKKCTQDGLLSEKQQKRWTQLIPEFVKKKITKDIASYYLKHINSEKVPESRRIPFFHPNECPFKFLDHYKLRDDDETLKSILTKYPNTPGGNQLPPIFEAARRGYLNIIEFLAPLSDDPNSADADGSTPILWAASKGHENVIKYLAPLTKTPNAPGWYKMTPILEAARRGYLGIIKILAPLTDDQNAADVEGSTPILWATRKYHPNVIKYLAPLVKNPNTPNGKKWTPILEAAKRGLYSIVQILAPLTDDPNAADAEGSTPILWAARNSHLNCVKFLAKLTNNPNAPNKKGETPSEVTEKLGNWSILDSFNTSRPSAKKSKK